jgi:copper resistance protein B
VIRLSEAFSHAVWVALALLVATPPLVGQQPEHGHDEAAQESAATRSGPTGPKVSAEPVAGGTPGDLPREPAPSPPAPAGARWPSPVADDTPFSLILLDVLEYQRTGSVDGARWDVVGWWGGDWRRLWVKSEGELYGGSGAGGQIDAQVLYGRLVSPFFDLQAGLRVEQHREVARDPTRVFAVLGVQGLSPYRFEVEPALFLSNKGKLSGRLTASYDLLLTQRLIAQPRFETEIAAQADREFGVEPGVNSAELGLRLRYEIRRELAPYLGLSYRRTLGETRERVLREGGEPNELQTVVGLRAWF